MLSRPLVALLVLIATPLLAAPAQEDMREQHSFTIRGEREVWRLIWRGTPSDDNSCGPADPKMAMTCPCSGIAYAQTGDLVLERERPGASPDRMALTPLFAGSDMSFDEKGPVAMLPRWPVRSPDIEHNPSTNSIRARPVVSIMRLRDYNHDGIASEFLLQVDTLPCGKHVLVAIGTTRDNPHLHALTSAEHSERPLALFQWQWDALARSSRPGKVMDWPCGDHGAEEETVMVLKTDGGRIHATRITSACTDITDATGGGLRHKKHVLRRALKREIM